MTVEERARHQYSDDTKLDARIALHRRFSTSPVSWARWVFDQMDLRTAETIVELGAGTGVLWTENRDRLPAALRLILTEPSPGMMRTLRTATDTIPGVTLRLADASHIDEPDQSIDAVIANHMLYELSDRESTFREVVRVLKPSGHFFAATNGRDHMRQLDALIALPERTQKISRTRFSLENGAQQLEPFFGSVRCVRQHNLLAVTDAAAVVAYVQSLSLGLSDADLERIRSAAQQTMAINGAFRITPDSGMFIATEPIAHNHPLG